MSKQKKIAVWYWAGLFLLAACARQDLAEGVSPAAVNAEPAQPAVTLPLTGVRSGADAKLAEPKVVEPDEDDLIRFMLGSASLSATEKHKLEMLADRLKADRMLVVMLLGHANDNGSAAYNLAISDGRLAAVADFLRKQGVSPTQVRKEAVGSERNPRDCRSQACRQRYRSVEVVTLPSR